MSSLISFNSSGNMSFLALPAVFLLIISTIFMGIVNIWMILKQKISDELSAHDIKINTSITAEITKIKNEINIKIGDKLFIRDTKVTNGLTAYLSEIISSFTVELDKINTELNSKLIAEIEKFKAHDAGYTTEA